MDEKFIAAVGKDRRKAIVQHLSGSKFQFEYVKQVSKRPDFGWFSWGYRFDSDKCVGPFNLLWYDTSENLHCDSVGKKRILRKIVQGNRR